MKRILALLCLTILLINISTVFNQELDDMENKKWRQAQKQLDKVMKIKESTPLNLTKSEEKAFQGYSKFVNQVKGKIMQQSPWKDTMQTKKPNFQSFLEMENQRRWQAQDEPKKFFGDEAYTKNILSFPLIGMTNIQGWSGPYWPMRNGELSVRYGKNDKNTIGQVDLQTGNYLRYYTWAESISMYAQPAEHNTYSNSPNYFQYVDDNYSPSEKYDLLLGDTNFTLTNYLKNEGKKYAWGNDMVGWFGICHGWAPASFSFPKPQRSVTLTSASGLNIRFLPDDIKGLASLFWANAQFTTLFAGARCEYYYPNAGWFTSPNCLSLNAGSFITILGNWVGMQGRNLVYEPSADPEIWNEPIRKYEMKYYNPLTNRFSNSAMTSRVDMSYLRGSSDSFLQYVAGNADPNAAYALGVYVKTTHTLFQQMTDLVHDDHTVDDKDESFEYDSIILLDSNMNILGGEWKHKTHPNFIWRYDETKSIGGVSDEQFPTFAWTNNLLDLVRASSNKGQPLKAVVNFLTQNAA